MSIKFTSHNSIFYTLHPISIQIRGIVFLTNLKSFSFIFLSKAMCKKTLGDAHDVTELFAKKMMEVF